MYPQHPEWTPEKVARLERNGRKRGSPPEQWLCRTEPLPIERWLGIETRSYYGRWRPFDFTAYTMLSLDADNAGKVIIDTFWALASFQQKPAMTRAQPSANQEESVQGARKPRPPFGWDPDEMPTPSWRKIRGGNASLNLPDELPPAARFLRSVRSTVSPQIEQEPPPQKPLQGEAERSLMAAAQRQRLHRARARAGQRVAPVAVGADAEELLRVGMGCR
jgi:hypothetical protein